MIIITKIYEPNPNTIQMVKSFEAQGYEVAVLTGPHKGNGETLRELYDCYKRAATGHDTFCYSDGGDTYCQKTFEPPKNSILYSTEQALWPMVPGLAYPENLLKVKSPWKYLNGGGVCGSLEVMIYFMESYRLIDLPNEATGQLELHYALMQAAKDNFPIKLDTGCKIFQSIAHGQEAFTMKDGLVYNNITKTIPAIIHANGITRTPDFFPFKIWH